MRSVRDRLASDLSLMFRIWRSGAAPFLIFRSKPAACKTHLPAKIMEFGLEPLQLRAQNLIPETSKPRDKHLNFVICGRKAAPNLALPITKLFEHTIWGGYVSDGQRNADFRKASAESAVARYFDHLIADIWASKYYGASLGCTIECHRRLLSGQLNQLDSTAFQIELPILNGATFDELYRLREEEASHFQRFRTSLRRALNERLAASTGTNDRQIAQEITEDFITPALGFNLRSLEGI